MKGFAARLLAVLLLALASSANASSIQERVMESLYLVAEIVFGRTARDVHASPDVVGKLSVIGAGLPRTGTKSVSKALELMGHRIYDLRDVFNHNHGEKWVECAKEFKEFGTTKKLDELVTEIEELGYTATLDTPGCFFAIPLAQVRPEAKVLLATRNNAKEWFYSFRTVQQNLKPLLYLRPWKMIAPPSDWTSEIMYILHGLPIANFTVPKHIWRPVPWYEELLPLTDDEPEFKLSTYTEYYDRHIKDVTSYAEGRVLKFHVKEGWAPWIPFFGMETTPTPEFPNVNDRKMLELMCKSFKFIGMTLPLWIMLVVGILVSIIRFIIGCVSPTPAKKEKMS